MEFRGSYKAESVKAEKIENNIQITKQHSFLKKSKTPLVEPGTRVKQQLDDGFDFKKIAQKVWSSRRKLLENNIEPYISFWIDKLETILNEEDEGTETLRCS